MSATTTFIFEDPAIPDSTWDKTFSVLHTSTVGVACTSHFAAVPYIPAYFPFLILRLEVPLSLTVQYTMLNFINPLAGGWVQITRAVMVIIASTAGPLLIFIDANYKVDK